MVGDYIARMDTGYDPEREPTVAMRLAAEADDAERLKWIQTALAWTELMRLRRTASREGGRTGEAA